MTSIISSAILRSSPLANPLSSGALSTSMASLTAMNPAAVLASTTTTATLSTATHPTASAAFIAPVLLAASRSTSAIQQQSFVSRQQPLSSSLSSSSSNNFVEASSNPAFMAPKVMPTDPSSFVPSNKSLRHALQVSRLSSSSSSSSSPPRQLKQRVDPPRVVGHRGALYDELENTRPGFLRCAELGCHAVELDVFLLKDNTLVVFHGGGSDDQPGDLDEYVVPSSGINGMAAGSILDLTYEQTQELVFNSEFEEFPCPADKIQQGRIPTLEQVLLDLKPTKTQVKIELKGPGVVEPVLELVERLGMVDQCQYSSFDHSRLKLLRDLRPEVGQDGRHRYKTGALFDDLPEDFVEQAVAVGASEVHLRYDLCSVERVNAIHQAGMNSMAWFRGPIGMKKDVTNKFWDVGNEDERCYAAVADTGVIELCVNRPDLLMRMLQEQHVTQPSQ